MSNEHAIEMKHVSPSPNAKDLEAVEDDIKVSREMSVLHIPQHERICIALNNVSFSVKNKSGPPRVILNKINAVFQPGEVCAIMASSGGGKTTLLDFLANRIHSSSGTLEGDVLVNGAPRKSSTFKHIAKYVPQEDLLVGTMTVHETLMFAAETTISQGVTHAKKTERVNRVIQELGLSVCRDTRIGTVFQKGISGGQKRRVSMGVELLSQPKVLLCDEPTSGLDSTSASRVVDILVNLAAAGTSVVCTIHQPSSDVFHRMHKLLLLSAGRVMYFGSTHGVVPYFSRIGKECPMYTNPADFLMDISVRDFEASQNKEKRELEVNALVEAYEKSQEFQNIQLTIEEEKHKKKNENKEIANLVEHDYETSFLKQLQELTIRTWKDNLRNPGIFWVRLAMYTMLSLMIGTLYLNSGYGQKSIQDRISILFFVAAFMVFMAISVIPAFISDRAVFQRERANGMYHVAAYVIANTLCGLPGLFMIALVSTSIIYPMIGFNAGSGRFGIFLLDLFISLWASESFMLVISAIVPYYIVGMALGAGVFGMFMLCEGFFLLRDNIPPYWIWAYYSGFHTYSFEMFMKNEFDTLRVDCDTPPCRFETGNDVLAFYGMENVNIGHDVAIIVCMGIIYRLIFFFILQKYHTGKR